MCRAHFLLARFQYFRFVAGFVYYAFICFYSLLILFCRFFSSLLLSLNLAFNRPLFYSFLCTPLLSFRYLYQSQFLLIAVSINVASIMTSSPFHFECATRHFVNIWCGQWTYEDQSTLSIHLTESICHQKRGITLGHENRQKLLLNIFFLLKWSFMLLAIDFAKSFFLRNRPLLPLKMLSQQYRIKIIFIQIKLLFSHTILYKLCRQKTVW